MNDWFDTLKAGQGRIRPYPTKDETFLQYVNRLDSVSWDEKSVLRVHRVLAKQMAQDEQCCRRVKMQAIRLMEQDRKTYWGSRDRKWPVREKPSQHPLMDVP